MFPSFLVILSLLLGLPGGRLAALSAGSETGVNFGSDSAPPALVASAGAIPNPLVFEVPSMFTPEEPDTCSSRTFPTLESGCLANRSLPCGGGIIATSAFGLGLAPPRPV